MRKNDKKSLREEKIKEVALDSFLKNGYGKTNLNDIIKQSGGSLSNIYNKFKNKEGLFLEILNDICKNNYDFILEKTNNIKSDNLKDILTSFGLIYIELFNDKRAISFGKIIYSQVYNKKIDLASWIEKSYKNSLQSILISYIKNQEKLSNIKDIEKICEIFCTLLKEPNFTLSITTNKKPLDKKEQKERVDFVVNLILNGV